MVLINKSLCVFGIRFVCISIYNTHVWYGEVLPPAPGGKENPTWGKAQKSKYIQRLLIFDEVFIKRKKRKQ